MIVGVFYILENKVGALGEAIAMYGILTLDKPEKEMYDYDLVNRWNGATIDVKAQTSNTPPKSEYIIRLTLGNHRHQVDHYVFVWIKRNWKQAWILGQLTPVKFFKTCKRINEGEVSPINGHKQRLDCLALSVNDLDPIEGTRIVSHE